MTEPERVVRIAHAYGNSRQSLDRALASDVDMIEVDCWLRGSHVYIHHERRLGAIPLLYDRIMKGHRPGPLALRFGRWYARPDFGTFRLDQLLDRVAGGKALLLDVKGRYSRRRVELFAATLIKQVRSRRAQSWVAVCGQSYPVLNALRRQAGDIEVRYSIEKDHQWESFLRKMRRDANVRRVCMAHGFMDPEKAALMRENRVNVYYWTVDDPERANQLVQQGADGIISTDLRLLSRLRS